jgi:hypothetical protein
LAHRLQKARSLLHIQFAGVTVITLKSGKASHAQDFTFNTDEELKKAWGE